MPLRCLHRERTAGTQRMASFRYGPAVPCSRQGQRESAQASIPKPSKVCPLASLLACKGHHVELRREARKLALPVGQRGQRDDDEVRPWAALVAQGRQEGDGLDGLAQTHLSRKAEQ